jgi:hypothetical protein
MFRRFIEATLLLLLAFAAPSAQAFFDPPWITPAVPRAGALVSVNIHGGICDAIFEWSGYPQVTRQGNAVRIVEYGAHVDFVDWCIYGVGTLAEPIGNFPPGDYTLTVDLLYDNLLYGPTTMTIGVVPFTVTSATTVEPVPTLGLPGRFVTAAFLLALAIRALRTRRRSHC